MDTQTTTNAPETKFCKHCGKVIPKSVTFCPECGKQVEETSPPAAAIPQIVINNTNSNVNSNTNTNTNNVGVPYPMMKPKNKWVAFLLCFLLGFFGAHKFYEGKTGMGLLYLFTAGLFGFGWIIDTIVLLFKPNPYYVK
ncbi:MAG: TM2 domain-containing protein [Ruminococcaceae bacterium]|nr:TM2 domain-containing protein [Oscillospiraceae bacterium]